ncbi:MAG: protein kinase domain-containing protein [Phycisphaerales bacterium]
MTPDRLKRVEEVYFGVSALPPPERQARLDALCNGDAELRQEVLDLLEHEPAVGEFLERPAVALPGSALDPGAGSAPVKDDLIGATLASWKIERRIASGGMGTVYFGIRDDGQFQQQVAIKVVKRGMDSEELIKRFRRERRALAALNHPNIARLLDGGMAPDGRPYLVMEYVPGEPIDLYCNRKRLTIPERLQLFRTVCDAVRAAHRTLIVHRDLKPGNILVTDDGVPKLLDFGIAKLVGGVEATRTIDAERRLTPEYASPEQAAGLPLTTSTDVYSLGVILYKLLCGRLPYRFVTKTSAEIERVIRQEPAAPPSGAAMHRTWPSLVREAPEGGPDADRVAHGRQTTPGRLRRALRGDLDNIVLMALRKEPERRYASVEQFGADIERFLQGMPVAARPDTFRYRTSKFVRRHAAAVLVGAGIAALLAVAVVAIAWQGQVAARERDAAYLARDQAEEVVKFLRDMLSSGDSAASRDVTVRTVLDRTAMAIEGQLAKDPLVQAAVRSTIAHSYLALGVLDEAERHMRAAYRTRLGRLGEDHHDVAESKLDLAALLNARRKYAEAETLLRESLEMHRRQRGPDNPDTGRVLNDLGAVLWSQGKLGEAAAAHEGALRVRRLAYGDESLPVAESLSTMAAVRTQRNDHAGAAELSADALRIRRKLLPSEHPLVRRSIFDLAAAEGRAGNLARAEELLGEAVLLSEGAVGPDHLDVGRCLHSLGAVRLQQGRWAEAEPVLRRGVLLFEGGLAPGDPTREGARVDLGLCLIHLGRDDEGEPPLRAGLEGLLRAGGELPESHLGALEVLRALYRRRGSTASLAEVEHWGEAR